MYAQHDSKLTSKCSFQTTMHEIKTKATEN